MLFRKDCFIGLDIGTSSIKMVQLFLEEEGSLRLGQAGFKEIDKTENGESLDGGIVSAIKELLMGINTKRAKVIVSINCPRTDVKITRTPYMPKSELYKGIKLEAKNHFPFSIDNSGMDLEILADVVEKGVRKHEVAVAVCPQTTLDRYLSILGKANITPYSLVPASYAMQRLIRYFEYPEKDKTTCFIDIGKVCTLLFICKDKTLMFSRKIPIAGDDVTKAMTGVLISDRGKIGLSIVEAEEIKRQIGIPEKVFKIINGKISQDQVLSLMRIPLDNMVNEINRCFDYYLEKVDSTKIGLIVLSGGGASLSGLISFLSSELGVTVKLADFLMELKAEADVMRKIANVSHRIGIAIGAALSSVKGINLLPPDLKDKNKKTVTRATIVMIATAGILTLVLVYMGMNIQLANYQKRISAAKFEFSGLKFQSRDARAYYLANVVLVDEPYWEDVFIELSNLVPPDVCITRLYMASGVITLEAVINAENTEQVLSDFMAKLENGMFKEVKLISARDSGSQSGNRIVVKFLVE